MCLCKSCIYWQDNDNMNSIMHPYDDDTYEEMVMPFIVKRCCCPNITLFERNPNSNGVSLCDGSHYHAAMYTGCEYGCVNGVKNER